MGEAALPRDGPCTVELMITPCFGRAVYIPTDAGLRALSCGGASDDKGLIARYAKLAQRTWKRSDTRNMLFRSNGLPHTIAAGVAAADRRSLDMVMYDRATPLDGALYCNAVPCRR